MCPFKIHMLKYQPPILGDGHFGGNWVMKVEPPPMHGDSILIKKILESTLTPSAMRIQQEAGVLQPKGVFTRLTFPASKAEK